MGKSGVKNRKLAGIRETDFRKPASILGGNGVGRKTRGKFFQIGEKGNVLTIKTHYGEDQNKDFLTADARGWTQMGNGINAEARSRRRNAKRKGGAGHAFHERARIRKIGAVTGQRLTDGFMEIAQNYGLTPSRPATLLSKFRCGWVEPDGDHSGLLDGSKEGGRVERYTVVHYAPEPASDALRFALELADELL